MAVLLSGFFQSFCWSVLVHFPGFLTEMGADESQIGGLYAASAAFALLLQPLVGKAMDQAGRRAVLVVAGVVNVVTLLLMMTVDHFGREIFVWFVIHRVMMIALFSAMLALSSDIVPIERRTEGISLLGLASVIPIATGGMFGDLAIAAGGFDRLFLVAAVSCLLSTCLVVVIPRLPPSDLREKRRGFFAPLRQANLLPLWLAGLVFAISLEVLFTFIRTFADERGAGSVGLFFIVYGGVGLIVRLALTPKMDQLPGRLLIGGAIGGYALGYMVLGGAQGPVGFVTAAVLCGCGHAVGFPVLLSQIVSRIRGSERGSAVAIFAVLFDLALLGAAPSVGVLIELGGYGLAFRFIGLVVAGGLIGYAVWDRRFTPMGRGGT